MRVLINGICGKMGREVANLVKNGYRGAELAGGVDPAVSKQTDDLHEYNSESGIACSFEKETADFDVIVDFSHHSITLDLLNFAGRKKKPLIIATTGQTDEEKKLIYEASKNVPIFLASNYSIGVATLISMAKTAVKMMPDADIEIVETHHNRKLDAPSGTAISLFEAVKSVREESEMKCGREGQSKRTKNEVGMHSLRLANVAGRHEVRIATESEEIVLKHEAFNRGVFAKGALDAAVFIIGKPAGLYGMADLMNG